MKATQHPFTGISARPGSASTLSRLHWLNACARRHRQARVPALGAQLDPAAALLAEGALTKRHRASANAIPQVLHIDKDRAASLSLGGLLMPEARVTNVATLSDARAILQKELFSLVVLDPDLPDGDAESLLALLAGSPLLVYSAQQPAWRAPVSSASFYLPKPWTSSRRLWTTISTMLGLAQPTSAGD
jgi:two-component system phosphate regulon response regulator OmpR